MAKIAIVGSGISGALISFMVKQVCPHVRITILDKARGSGGRMCTIRSPLNEQCTADLGAQYFSIASNTSAAAKWYYEELIKENLLEPLCVTIDGMRSQEQKLKHYVCTKGSGSVVKHFIDKSGCQIDFCERVIEVFPSANNKSWVLKTENNTRDGFDALILTIPVPQVLQIQGVLQFLSAEQKNNLKEVTYTSRFAVGLFYNEAADFISSIPWGIKYVPDNPVIRYMSIDNKRRNSSSQLPSVVIHTTKEFGKAHIDSDVSEVQQLILDSAKSLIPNLSEPSYIKFHKWRYSQVEKPFPGRPGCIIVKDDPLFICGGDGFSASTFDDCLFSAEKVVQCVLKNEKMFPVK